MSGARRRFYRQVSVDCVLGPADEGAFYAILLDGKPVKTPGGARLALPSLALAEAVAEEWHAQGESIRSETMMLTKLANTAIDRAGPNREAAAGQILALAGSDVICYRAEAPAGLVSRQCAAWDPLIVWAEERHGVRLKTVAGLSFIEQPQESLEALIRVIAAQDAFALTGLHAAAALLGSAIIALALVDNRLDAEGAFAVAHADEMFQSEKWGLDAEAQSRSRARSAELAEIARFLHVLRDNPKS